MGRHSNDVSADVRALRPFPDREAVAWLIVFGLALVALAGFILVLLLVLYYGYCEDDVRECNAHAWSLTAAFAYSLPALGVAVACLVAAATVLARRWRAGLYVGGVLSLYAVVVIGIAAELSRPERFSFPPVWHFYEVPLGLAAIGAWVVLARRLVKWTRQDHPDE